MSSPDDVRAFLRNYLSQTLKAQGQHLSSDLSDDSDLLLLGIIDSLGLVSLMAAMTEHFGTEIDFEGLHPEKMTIVGPLCTFVWEQVAKSWPPERI